MRILRPKLEIPLASSALRVVKAMALLERGQTVETSALDLGYGGASAFIRMFKRLTDATPDEFRKGALIPVMVMNSR
ncbi:MAG: hypothetical protein A2503_16455 [Burkholderiales bacterium RIFOXYD12_FULL_59_19]|nr:MAG: hypothetical protein A2503_16455 [Burkholderiales bacterium RIFOXYD12_FULL_59_19]